MAAQVKILNGPSKFDLMVSLFEGNPHDRSTVGFSLAQPLPGQQVVGFAQSPKHSTGLSVAVTSVTQEDGSGDSWSFRGWSPHMRFNGGVSGFFSTKTRKGWIEEEKPEPKKPSERTFV